ncbi:DUF3859 domain-containing protein [Ningiella sp. W23]|uniref:DUF3859 domain-containing protein n=1 Tax=Ningiella sp. W23 TaxID=3023715 RepID=UPI00375703FF
MAKTKPVFSIESYGIYDGFIDGGKTLPKIAKHTHIIPAQIDIEFGFVLHAKKAKGEHLSWCIAHPNICDKQGVIMAPFEGGLHVRTNDWRFYLGDTIWAPEQDKLGSWHMLIKHNDKIIAEQIFEITLEDEEEQKQAQFWKKRGF